MSELGLDYYAITHWSQAFVETFWPAILAIALFAITSGPTGSGD